MLTYYWVWWRRIYFWDLFAASSLGFRRSGREFYAILSLLFIIFFSCSFIYSTQLSRCTFGLLCSWLKCVLVSHEVVLQSGPSPVWIVILWNPLPLPLYTLAVLVQEQYCNWFLSMSSQTTQRNPLRITALNFRDCGVCSERNLRHEELCECSRILFILLVFFSLFDLKNFFSSFVFLYTFTWMRIQRRGEDRK